MKKIIFIISFLLAMQYSTCVYATETNEILEEQEEALNIFGFIQEAENYTEDTFLDIDISSIYSGAISGDIDLNIMVKGAIKLLGSETLGTIKTLRIYFNYNNNT